MKIKIKNLKAMVSLGCYSWEKQERRPIIINAVITLHDCSAGHTDTIDDTIDYDLISGKIIRLVASKHYNMVEHMVAEVLNLLGTIPKIAAAEIEIDKPGAIEAAESVSVTDSREYS